MADILLFEVEKETKNTVRLTEKVVHGKPPIIGTLYVAKWWLGDFGGATEVKVTLERVK